MTVADAAGFPAATAADVIGETVAALRAGWPEIRREPVFPALIEHMDERLAKHPLR